MHLPGAFLSSLSALAAGAEAVLAEERAAVDVPEPPVARVDAITAEVTFEA